MLLKKKLSKSSTPVTMIMYLFLHLGQCFLSITSVLVGDLLILSAYLADCYSVKKYNGRTPEESSHSSRSSFDETKEEMAEKNKVPKNHFEAKRQVC